MGEYSENMATREKQIYRTQPDRQTGIDLIKAFAIFTVLWGHAIQYWHGANYDFWNDPFFKFIYGFHMPLFALISGYLFSGSLLRHSAKDIAVGKFKKLIVPCVFWAFVLPLLDAFLSLLSGTQLSIVKIGKSIVWDILSNFWFYKAIFAASILCLFIEKTLKGNIIIYILLCVCTIFAPNFSAIESIAFVLPFFVIGLLYRKSNGKFQFKRSTLIFAVISYILLICFYQKDYYIYISGMNILCAENPMVQLWNIGFRFLTGLVGSVAIIGILIKMDAKLGIKQKDFVRLFAPKTGDIYLMSSIMFVYSNRVIHYFQWNSNQMPFYGITVDILLIPVSVLIAYIFVRISDYISKYPRVKKWVIGS